MRRSLALLLAAVLSLSALARTPEMQPQRFPDGTPISQWHLDNSPIDLSRLGPDYRLTDYGVVADDSTLLQTEAIQAVIDRAADNGGGVVVVPRGVFLSAALFFKPRTHLHLEEGARLKATDDVGEYPIVPTRMEGQSVNYLPALINADHVDGFTITGQGTLDGNGYRSWRAFWKRRQWNSQCTNMEELRPRTIYVSCSRRVTIDGITIRNSPFWSTHYYRCDSLRLLNLHITSPVEPVKAPSTDAIDLDVCSNVVVRGCYMSVNDDAIALKGGKGPWADEDKNNGGNYNILVEDCTFGPNCHAALTCGSESIHDRNVVVRGCTMDNPHCMLNLKMRPDTPQRYEYITVQNVTGSVETVLRVKPWTQFFDLKGRTDLPPSITTELTLQDLQLECTTFLEMEKSDKYQLSHFTFLNLSITTQHLPTDCSYIEPCSVSNVIINGTSWN